MLESVKDNIRSIIEKDLIKDSLQPRTLHKLGVYQKHLETTGKLTKGDFFALAYDAVIEFENEAG